MKSRTKRTAKRFVKRTVPVLYRKYIGRKGQPSKAVIHAAAKRIFSQLQKFAQEEAGRETKRLRRAPSEAFIQKINASLDQMCAQLVFDYSAFMATKFALDRLGIKKERPELFVESDKFLQMVEQKTSSGLMRPKDAVLAGIMRRIFGLIGKKNGVKFAGLLSSNFTSIRSDLGAWLVYEKFSKTLVELDIGEKTRNFKKL